jgi:hypothetical protein
VPGADDAGSLRRILTQKVNHIPAAAAWHPQIDDGCVKNVFASSFDGGARGLADDSHMPHTRQLVPHQFGD